MLLCIKLIAHGSVQGVGFRSFAIRIGEQLGLKGYAKNLAEGAVEIVAEGDEAKIEEFCRRLSVREPFGIRVDKLEILEKKEIAKKSFAAFLVAY
jgi:acylphosphatase